MSKRNDDNVPDQCEKHHTPSETLSDAFRDNTQWTQDMDSLLGHTLMNNYFDNAYYGSFPVGPAPSYSDDDIPNYGVQSDATLQDYPIGDNGLDGLDGFISPYNLSIPISSTVYTAAPNDFATTSTNITTASVVNTIAPAIIAANTNANTNANINANNNTNRHRCRHHGCITTFSRRADVTRHMKTHSQPQLNCPVSGCDRQGDKGFSRLDNLRNHQRKKHGMAV